MISLSAKKELAQRLQSSPDVIRFEEEPKLAALCTGLGLEFEMGRKDFDRLSPFLGVEVSGAENPWLSELILSGGDLGVEFRRKDGGTLALRHPDLQYVIDPSSFDDRGELSRIRIFPSRVAANYREKGFELLIVRDWILTSSLNVDPATQVSYLYANTWEIENNVGKMQSRLACNRQLAFSGTHDIVDHLLNSDRKRYDQSMPLFARTSSVYKEMFSADKKATAQRLLLSYFIGVVLDDLAQPKWYASKSHHFVIEMACLALENSSNTSSTEGVRGLPVSFYKLMEIVRSQSSGHSAIASKYMAFIDEISSPSFS